MRKLLLILFLSVHSFGASAQELVEEPIDTIARAVSVLQQESEIRKRIQINGYIQAQYQVAQSPGAATFEGGNFPAGSDKRFSIRRGRIKVTYNGPTNDRGISVNNYMIQFDLTERGLRLMDGYARFTDPIYGVASLTVGLQNRPFGYAIAYSSGVRETPERGRMSQLLFPNERDLGAMLTIQAPKTSRWHWLKWEGGFFNGHSTPNVGQDASDFDKKKDFITHLSMSRSNTEETFKYGGGVSYYTGGFRLDSVDYYGISNFTGTSTPVYTLISNRVQNWNNGDIATRRFTRREYWGADLQLIFSWFPGLTTFRAEYIQGYQPGVVTSDNPANDTRSPISSTPITRDVYQRQFNGAYFYFIQNIMQSPFQFVVKYDWYDPNTKVEGGQIGQGNAANGLKLTTASDIKFQSIGVGTVIHMDAGIKLMIYYDMPRNETTPNLARYKSDLKDNVLTLRLQSSF